MKQFKKLMAVMMCVTMMLSMAVPVLAVEGAPATPIYDVVETIVVAEAEEIVPLNLQSRPFTVGTHNGRPTIAVNLGYNPGNMAELEGRLFIRFNGRIVPFVSAGDFAFGIAIRNPSDQNGTWYYWTIGSSWIALNAPFTWHDRTRWNVDMVPR